MVWAAIIRNWKPLIALLVVLVLLALAGLGFWRGLVAIERLQETAASAARDQRDAHWTAEIAKANAAVERARAEQAQAAMAADATLRETTARFQTELNDLEARNAALPDGARRGLGRDRVRLLNGAAR